MKTIVVTGAAGFIGSCLVSRLNKSGFTNIIVVDDGLVVEQGKHGDLLAQKGYYYQLWQAQKDHALTDN